MSRREHSIPPAAYIEKPPRRRCLAAICVFWKFLSSFTLCIISHVTLISLVVAYCVGGAALFEKLEAENEIEVKRGISKMRKNVSDFIWNLTEKELWLYEGNWTKEVAKRLAVFESEILSAMKTQGWDGNENEKQLQWSFHGALFYSIIVITTIGYGHIAPRTDWGKVTTIFYAIIGIPLMLLCLSNIGDVMATSFRFLYWRVCCYVCTREPKRRRQRYSSRSRQRSTRSQPPALRRSIRASQRSADSGFATVYDQPGMFHAYSDPELRHTNFDEFPRHRRDDDDFYRNKRFDRDRPPRDRNDYNDMDDNNDIDYDVERQPSRNNQRFSNRNQNRERMRDRHTIERERNLSRGRQQFDLTEDFEEPITKRAQSTRSMRATSAGRDLNRISSQNLSTPQQTNRSRSQPNTPKSRAKSADPRSIGYDEVDDEVARKTPILCNRYAINDLIRREAAGSNRSHKRRSLGDDNRISHRNSGGSPRNQSMPPHSLYDYQQHQGRERERYEPSQQHQRYGYRLDVSDIPSTGGGGIRRTDSGSSRRDRKRNDRDSVYSQATPSQPPQQKQSRNSRYDDYYDDKYDEDLEMQPIRRDRRSRRSAAPLPPSPRIMSPMGFAIRRQQPPKLKPYAAAAADDDSYYDDEGDSYGEQAPGNRPVPIWLCVFLVVSYIIAGAFLFSQWEKWSFLDSAYFCFITLTTIGFGDFVPAQGVKESSKESIALCSLYLLFGISLLAMSFNLVQEEVIANVKEVARRLGILKEQEQIDD